MKTIFDYSLKSIKRHGSKNISIAVIFTMLVWLLSSVIFITNSIKEELLQTASATPHILINKQVAGRYLHVNENDIDPLWEIAGVTYVKGRVWGQYFLEFKNVFITLFGITPYEETYNKHITKIVDNILDENIEKPAFLSQNMYELLKPYRTSKDMINFERFDGGFEEVRVAGKFKIQSELFSNDVILMPTSSVRDIFGIKKGDFTDIIIKVSNPLEVNFIAAKIMHKYPHLKVTTKDEILKDFKLLYQYKSGWFLLLFIVCFVTFAIILYDKASGIRSEEKREIGILKALGWEINHIIYYKLFESVVISMFSFFIGLALALVYVYIFQAPLLKYVFIGYSELKQSFSLVFKFSFQEFSLLFFTTVPLYVAASIIPSWKVAVDDTAEMIR